MRTSYKKFFSVLTFALIASFAFEGMGKKAGDKLAKQVLFKKSYSQLCSGLKEISERDRPLFCECMVKKYISSGYTDEGTLKIVKKIYNKTLKKGLSDYESLAFNFDASAAEECLEEVSKK